MKNTEINISVKFIKGLFYRKPLILISNNKISDLYKNLFVVKKTFKILVTCSY